MYGSSIKMTSRIIQGKKKDSELINEGAGGRKFGGSDKRVTVLQTDLEVGESQVDYKPL